MNLLHLLGFMMIAVQPRRGAEGGGDGAVQLGREPKENGGN